MANEIYNTSWWGNALETARTAGTDPDFFGSQMKLLTDEQPNLVTNGDFSNGSNNWNVETGWSIANGIATVNHNATTAITQSLPSVKANSLYRVKLTISNYTQGLIQPQFYGQVITQFTGNGEHSIDVVATANAPTLYLYALSNPNFSIDDVSITLLRCDYDGVSGELVQNGSFNQIGSEEVSNGDFSQIGSEEVSNGNFSQIGNEIITNGNFDQSGTATTSSYSLGWYSPDTNDVVIANNLMTINNVNGGRAYATNGSSSTSVVTSGKHYKLTYRVVENNGATNFLYHNGSAYVSAPSTVGVHTIYYLASGSIFLLRNNTTGTNIVLDDVSLKEVGQDWTSVGLVTFADGKASFVDNGTNTNSYIQQNIFTANKFYKVSIDVTRYNAGRIQILYGASTYYLNISGGIGTYVVYLKPSSNLFRIKRDGGYSNFDFDIDNVSVKEVGQDWQFGTGWSISNGKARASGVSGSNNLTQSGILTVGKTYKITITVSEYVSGTVEVSAGASPRGEMNANGTYTFYQTATPSTSFYIISQVFNGAVDNVSVKEVGQNWILSAGWSLEIGKAMGSAEDTYDNLTQNNLGILNKNVRLTFDIVDYTSGTFRLIPSDRGDNLDERFSGNGSYTVEYESLNNDLRFQQQNFVGGVTNISVVQLEDHVEATKCLADWIHRFALEDLKY